MVLPSLDGHPCECTRCDCHYPADFMDADNLCAACRIGDHSPLPPLSDDWLDDEGEMPRMIDTYDW